ncbi:unnamed protein product [Protopolystoma xenopodis]|uniref:Uncharacterized protein n=1 Tax=Protopolystoma xenopodis TaxID=117903 RepID=A0A448XMR7_9PLAT|nr:unnamed protein product [Protopolystoma xenopodis]
MSPLPIHIHTVHLFALPTPSSRRQRPSNRALSVGDTSMCHTRPVLVPSSPHPAHLQPHSINICLDRTVSLIASKAGQDASKGYLENENDQPCRSSRLLLLLLLSSHQPTSPVLSFCLLLSLSLSLSIFFIRTLTFPSFDGLPNRFFWANTTKPAPSSRAYHATCTHEHTHAHLNNVHMQLASKIVSANCN